MIRRIAALLAIVLAGVGGACVPPGAPNPPYYPDPPQQPAAERLVYGDSISWQVATTNPGDGRVWHYQAGTDLGRWAVDIQSELGGQPAPKTVFLALGTNDAGLWDGRDGWTVDDEAHWSLIFDLRPADTCMIVLLPWVGPEAEARYPGVTAQVDAARAFITAEATRTGAIVSDWQPYAQGVLLDDGIHLNGPDGVAQRLAEMADAESRCP